MLCLSGTRTKVWNLRKCSDEKWQCHGFMVLNPENIGLYCRKTYEHIMNIYLFSRFSRFSTCDPYVLRTHALQIFEKNDRSQNLGTSCWTEPNTRRSRWANRHSPPVLVADRSTVLRRHPMIIIFLEAFGYKMGPPSFALVCNLPKCL